MKLYFQCHMGIAGDMTVASLAHLIGVSSKELQEKLNQWKFPVEAKLVKRTNGGISGLALELVIRDKLPEVYFRDIEEIISEVNEDDEVKKGALDAFRYLFEAEGEVHGKSYNKVHLHEAASWDAIFDIFVTSWLIHRLSPEDVLHSPVNVGSGTVRTSHGMLPVPVPAVSALLKGRTVISRGPEAELTTPTGAVILKTFAKEGQIPQGKLRGEGRGLGTMEFSGYPNFLRVIAIEDGENQGQIVEVEAEVDDATGELLSVLWRELEGKVLDMFFVPVYMKKGRPGHLIKIITRPESLNEVARILFLNTTTIGVRYSYKNRIELEREIVEVEINGFKAKIKVAYLEDRVVNALPEFYSCQELAKRLKISVKEAYFMILEAWRKR